jgi:uncharacterized protein
MSEHPNATLVRKVAGAFIGGDLDAFVNAYAEDAIYRVGGHNLASGNYRGHKEIYDFIVKLGEMTGGTIKLEVEDVMGADNHAMMFWRLLAERNGKSLDAHGAMAFKVNDEGKFSESWFLYSDQKEYDNFYS